MLITGKVALSCPAFLDQGDFQGPSKSIQGADAQPRSSMNLALVVVLQTATKANKLAISGGNSTTVSSKEGYRGHKKNLSFIGKWPEMKDRSIPINILELETVLKACQKFETDLRRDLSLFQIDNNSSFAKGSWHV